MKYRDSFLCVISQNELNGERDQGFIEEHPKDGIKTSGDVNREGVDIPF